MLAMTRRTFDLWLTLLAVFGGGAATVGAVWFGAKLALSQDRAARRDERREAAINSTLNVVRAVQQQLERIVVREQRPIVLESNLRTIPGEVRAIDAERLRTGAEFRSLIDSFDGHVIDAEGVLPVDVVTNRVRLTDGLRGVAVAVEISLSDGDTLFPNQGRNAFRTELLQVNVNALRPTMQSVGELLTFAAKGHTPPYALDLGPLDELEAYVEQMQRDQR